MNRMWRKPEVSILDPGSIFSTECFSSPVARRFVRNSATKCISMFTLSAPRRVLGLLLRPSIILVSLHVAFASSQCTASQCISKIFEYVSIVRASDVVSETEKLFSATYLLAVCSNLCFRGTIFSVEVPRTTSYECRSSVLQNETYWKIISSFALDAALVDESIRLAFVSFLIALAKSQLCANRTKTWFRAMVSVQFYDAVVDSFLNTHGLLQRALLDLLILLAKFRRGCLDTQRLQHIRELCARFPEQTRLKLLLWLLCKTSQCVMMQVDAAMISSLWDISSTRDLREALTAVIKCSGDTQVRESLASEFSTIPDGVVPIVFSCLTWNSQLALLQRFMIDRVIPFISENNLWMLVEYASVVPNEKLQDPVLEAILRLTLPAKYALVDGAANGDTEIVSQVSAIELCVRLCECARAAEQCKTLLWFLRCATDQILAAFRILWHHDESHGHLVQLRKLALSRLGADAGDASMATFLVPVAGNSQDIMMHFLQQLQNGCLNVSKRHLQGALAHSFFGTIKQFDIRTLIVFGNNISDSGARAISMWLSDSLLPLQHLDIGRCGITGWHCSSWRCAS